MSFSWENDESVFVICDHCALVVVVVFLISISVFLSAVFAIQLWLWTLHADWSWLNNLLAIAAIGGHRLVAKRLSFQYHPLTLSVLKFTNLKLQVLEVVFILLQQNEPEFGCGLWWLIVDGPCLHQDWILEKQITVKHRLKVFAELD
jgi:hypothetical protein